jgi:hypothetical protein
MFENGALRRICGAKREEVIGRICGAKREEVIGRWRKLHNLDSLRDIGNVIIPRG